MQDLEDRADAIGHRKRNRFDDLRNPQPGEQGVDPLPQEDRLALADEIGPAAGRALAGKVLRRQQMGVGDIVDIRDIDQVAAVADSLQQPLPAAGDQPRDQVGSPGPRSGAGAKHT